jgi:hypothetical protein
MKKILFYIFIFSLINILLFGCTVDKIDKRKIINKEKIGVEFTVVENSKKEPSDSHGRVENYEKIIKDNRWITKFKFMNSTDVQGFKINSSKDILQVKSDLDKGEAWIKITQGDILESDIQKVKINSEKTTNIDLSQWKKGEIIVWLVVENGENGSININHIKK